jgi:hypothetical protein
VVPQGFPCSIDVDLHLDFAVLSPIDLVGDAVPVDGC